MNLIKSLEYNFLDCESVIFPVKQELPVYLLVL